MRYFLKLAYRGTRYHGWQAQPNALGVQQVVEEALSTLLRAPTSLTGSGRTDAGVHATGQVAHFDAPPLPDPAALVHRLNRFLPPDIAVDELWPVPDGAHARYDATERRYAYRISHRKDPFGTDLVTFDPRPYALELMNEAARYLLTTEDFESFSRVKTDVTHFRCQVTRATWTADDHTLTFHVSANRFLRGMVRALVGTLLEVGAGRMAVDEFREVIDARNRRRAGRAAPPKGLYLTAVRYPPALSPAARVPFI